MGLRPGDPAAQGPHHRAGGGHQKLRRPRAGVPHLGQRLRGGDGCPHGEDKELDTLRREARGQAVSYKFHAKLAFNRIREAGAAITKRRKQLYLSEAQRRLRALGKQLKISKGTRALAGKPTAVVPLNDPTA